MLRARQRAYYHANKDKVREQNRAYRQRPEVKEKYRERRQRKKLAKPWVKENPDLETKHDWGYLNDYYRPTPGGLSDICYQKSRTIDAILSGKKPETPKPAPPKPTVVIRRRAGVVS